MARRGNFRQSYLVAAIVDAMTTGEQLEQSQTRHTGKWRRRTGMWAAAAAVAAVGVGVDAYFVLHDTPAVRSGDTYQSGIAPGKQMVDTYRVVAEDVVALGLLAGAAVSAGLGACASLDQLGDRGSKSSGD